VAAASALRSTAADDSQPACVCAWTIGGEAAEGAGRADTAPLETGLGANEEEEAGVLDAAAASGDVLACALESSDLDGGAWACACSRAIAA
jgi:hypothetical protein